jgi:hypothetical protein
MAELLLFAWDHSTQSVPKPSQAVLAALPKRYDLIAVQPDGWGWGVEELANPWFRVLAWPEVALADLQALLSPLLPSVDSDMNPTTYWQYRGFYLDLNKVPGSLSISAWFADTSRAAPRLNLTDTGPVIIAAAKSARMPIAIPFGSEL